MAKGGNVRVSITGDAHGLTKATREAEGAIHRLTKSVGRGAAYALGAGGFGGGMYALFDITRKSVEEFRESERVSKQTAAALKSTGQVAGVTAKQISDLANSLKKKTAIDDEAIQSAENVLLTFTNVRNLVGKNNDIFNQATKATLDLSTAMKQDFKSSAVQVGKALNDPIKGITALQRIGVTFTQQQKDQVEQLVKTGHALDAQKMILKELNTEFGGSAAKQATGFKRLQVTLGDVAEAAGRKLAPSIDRLSKKTDLFVRQMLDGTGAGGRFAQQMKGVAADLKKLLGPLADIAKFLVKNPGWLKAAGAAWVAYKVVAIAQITEIKVAATASFFGLGKGKGSTAEKAGRVAGKSFAAGFITLGLSQFADDFGVWLAKNLPDISFKINTKKFKVGGVTLATLPTGISIKVGSPVGRETPDSGSVDFSGKDRLYDVLKPRRGGGGGGPAQPGTFNTGSGGSSGSGGGSSSLVSWARQMIGHFKESTGFNTGPELDKLQKEFGTHAAAWCAEFATKALVKAGAPKELLTARVADLRSWAQAGSHGLSKGFKTKPQVGDLMLFGNDHVGIVDKVNKNGTVTTIEGNTSSPNGVKRVTRNIGSGQYARVNGSYGGSNTTLLDLALGAGFSAKEAPIAAAIALAESGGDPTAHHTNDDGSTDSGLWQINSVHKWAENLDLFDPQQNAYAAHRVYKMQGWRAWTMYRNGQYKKYLGQAGAVDTPAGFAPSFSDLQDRADKRLNRRTLAGLRPDLSAATKAGRTVSRSIAAAGNLASRFDRQSRIFDLSDEDLDTPNGRKARANELNVLKGIKGREYDADVAARDALKKSAARVKAAVKKIRAELKKKTSPGHRGFLKAVLRKYVAKYREIRAQLHAMGETIADIIVEITGIQDAEDDLLKTPLPEQEAKEAAEGTAVSDEGNLLAHIDALERAGDITPEQARSMKIASIQAALDSWNLTPDERLELRGELRDLTKENTDSLSGLTEQVKALTDEVKKQNEFAESVTAVSLGAAWKALADMINGQIGGYAGAGGRALTAGAGNVARY